MIRPAARFLLALACVLAAFPAWAGPLVEMQVIDRESGEWLAPMRHRGQHWIAGEPGHRYTVRITNTTARRVLVVLSIDGINAVTGETAHPSQAGYVLEPWQTTRIEGWRKSLEDVAQFVFTNLPDSYAARTGRPDNVGVIGMAVFEEARPVYETPAPIAPAADGRAPRERAASSHAPGAAAESMAREPQRQRLGTGHGDREWSPVSRTGFDRASHSPAQITQVRYDDRHALVARGVLPRHAHPRWRSEEPRAFPGGFVADPPRW